MNLIFCKLKHFNESEDLEGWLDSGDFEGLKEGLVEGVWFVGCDDEGSVVIADVDGNEVSGLLDGIVVVGEEVSGLLDGLVVVGDEVDGEFEGVISKIFFHK